MNREGKAHVDARIPWPEGRDFAFTMFDDTDFAEMPDIREVYALLADLGIFTTKSVWPIRGTKEPLIGGATCEQEDYLDWALDLQRQGFEIALHNVAYSTSERGETLRGFDRFKGLFGHDPYTLANHASNREGIYWGNHRLTGLHQSVYNALTRNRRNDRFEGHIAESPLFWGDICKSRVGYVRNFVYGDVNTLKNCPYMPYVDPDRPYVNAWFASSEGPRADILVQTLDRKNVERLAREGGACVIYTHLGQDCCVNGKLHSGFRRVMTELSKMNGWFVPVHRFLDYLVEVKGLHVLTGRQRKRLERRWLWDKVRTRGRG
jgi:hypothetical protein